jgi:hypothetical protein
MDAHKLLGIGRPRRELDIVDAAIRLRDAEVNAIHIAQHLGQEEQLGHQLLDVLVVAEHAAVARGQRVKQAIGVVKVSALQLDRVRREGLEPEQVEEHKARIRVVRAIVVLGQVGILKVLRVLVALQHGRNLFVVQGADRSTQVAITAQFE